MAKKRYTDRSRGEGKRLWDVIQKIHDDNTKKIALNPAWMATEGMREIKFPRTHHQLGYIGCHLQMTEIARHILRGYDPKKQTQDALDSGEDMFPDTLQDRYPLKPKSGENPTYILLEYLPESDKAWNVARMRQVGGALLRHADALDDYSSPLAGTLRA